MINKVFTEQIGHHMEVYIDDIVVKRKKVEEHVKDYAEVFNVLRKFRMKLNFKNCVFKVAGGKILGFMVTQKGIEANPKKIKAIIDGHTTSYFSLSSVKTNR